MKSTITIFDVEGIRKPEVIEYNGLLSDFVFEKYGSFDVPTKIYSGGLNEQFLIAEFDEESEPSKDEFIRLNMHHDKVYIVHSPLGAGVVAFFWSVVQNIAIAAAVAIVTSAIMGKPDLPEGTRSSQGSPNNNVGPQQNTARPFDRVPDVYGEDRCTPDLISSGTFEFINHIKYITQDMCVSIGYGDISDVKTGETPSSEIPGFELDIFEPGQYPDEILKERISNEVKALTLNPPNEAGDKLTSDNYVNHDSVNNTGYILGFASFPGFTIGQSAILDQVNVSTQAINIDGTYIVNSNSRKSVDATGQVLSYSVANKEITITGDYTSFSSESICFINLVKNIANEPNKKLTGAFTIVSAGLTSIVLSSLTEPEFDGYLWYDSEVALSLLEIANVSSVSPNWPLVTTGQIIENSPGTNYDPTISGPDEVKERGPFTVPGNNNEEVWFDTQFPRGLAYKQTNNLSVTVNTLFEEIDDNDAPTGYKFDFNETYTDNEIDPRFYTTKVNSTTRPLFVPNKRYRVTRKRVSNSALGDAEYSEDCQWTRLAGIENIAKPDNTGTTRIKIKTQATEQTAALQQSQVNLEWTRKCLTYDGVNVIGNLETGAGLTASRRMADNFITYAFNKNNAYRNESNVDINSIYEIQNKLDSVFSGEKGEFSFTFANKNEPVVNEMRQIADAARCFLTYSGSIISMVRDEEQPFPKQLFNRRNKIPYADKKSYITSLPLDYDGIELEYKDREDDETRTIKLPDDLPINDPNYGNTAVNYLQVTAVGMRNRSQAWDRAQYEYNKMIYKRVSFETSVTDEGLFLNLNSRIEVTDSTRPSKGSDGEVLGINGLIVDTSELFIPEQGVSYSAIFRGEDGTVSSAIPVTARDDTEYGFILSSSIELYLRGKEDYQLGSLYNIAPDNSKSSSYLVQSITPSDVGEVALELINYDSRYYQADNQTPPEA